MDDTLLRNYLLGTLDEDERDQIEESIRMGHMTTSQLSIAEDELIDDYVSGQMSVEDREHFEKFFLIAPYRAEKLRFGQMLNSFLLQASQKKEPDANPTGNGSGSTAKDQTSIIPVKLNRWVKIALFCCVAVVLGFGSFVIARIQSLKNQVESIRHSEEQLRIRIGKIERNLNGDDEGRGSSSQNLLKDSRGRKIGSESQTDFAIAKWEKRDKW